MNDVFVKSKHKNFSNHLFMQVSYSILSADLLHIGEDIEKVSSLIDSLHFDVMDGHFVEHISFGIPVLEALPKLLPIDVHLMTTNPLKDLLSYAPLARTIYMHAEVLTEEDLLGALATVATYPVSLGIAINPETHIATLYPLLQHIEHVLIMSVTPGAGGQLCKLETLEKIPEIHTSFPQMICAVDGGMNEHTAPLAKEKGAACIVAGSYIAKAAHKSDAIARLR